MRLSVPFSALTVPLSTIILTLNEKWDAWTSQREESSFRFGRFGRNMARCVATWRAALLHAALRVQVYDQHLGAVNTITFIDDNRRWLSGFHSRPCGLTRARATLRAIIARMFTQL